MAEKVLASHTTCDYDVDKPEQKKAPTRVRADSSKKKHGDEASISIAKDQHPNTCKTAELYLQATDKVSEVTEWVGAKLSACLTCGGMDGVWSLPTGSFRFNSPMGGTNPYGKPEHRLSIMTCKVQQATSNSVQPRVEQIHDCDGGSLDCCCDELVVLLLLL